MSILNRPHFHDEVEAFAKLESVVWPEGPVCPHCGGKERIYTLKNVKDKKGRVRHGLKKCGHCRKQFTARVGTVFESAHIPLHKLLQAVHLLCSSKKGISSHQLHRTLEITYEAAWFMSHRIREAMRSGELAPPMGSNGGIVEADETFIGNKKGVPKKRGYAHKHAVMSLVERGGELRSFHIDKADSKTVMPIVRENVAKEARVMTDEAAYYNQVGDEFAEHGVVNHGKGQYRKGDAHTNTLENYYSVFKRGMKGIYQHCSEKHLHRYVAEFDFRHNNRAALEVDDEQRAEKALQGIKGKRLKYKDETRKVK